MPSTKLAVHRHHHAQQQQQQHHHHRSSSSEFGSPSDFPRLAQYIRYENSTQGKNSQPSDIGISLLDDVDAVQVELEALWTNVSVRIRTLKASQVIVNESTGSTAVSNSPPSSSSSVKDSASTQNAKASSSTSSSKPSLLSPPSSPVVRRTAFATRKASASPLSASLRAAIISRRCKKKLRGDRNSLESLITRAATKPARSGQNRTHSMSKEVYPSRQPAPGHFWDFVDSYCRDLTFADLQILDKIVSEHTTAVDNIFDIPPLGKHFRPKDTENSSSARLTREKVLDRSRDVCGPLTQRLVSALVDNRVHNYRKNGGLTGEDTAEGLFINRPGLVTALGLDAANGVNNTSGILSGEHTLESRLKKILTEQGFLLPESVEHSLSSLEEKDEILVDILRTQDSLHSLHKINAEKLADLQSLAKKEIMRSQVKLDMEKADKEVLEAYRLISTSRSKKKPLTKRERDLATRALDHRRVALVKLQKPLCSLPELEEDEEELEEDEEEVEDSVDQ